MRKATDELLKTHLVIKKLLKEFVTGRARFAEVTKTLHRAVAAHAWFEDSIFHPALRASQVIDKRFVWELVQEHKDLEHLLISLQKMRPGKKRAIGAYARQIRVILETHLEKEKSALYPLAEEILDAKTLAKLADKMESRKATVRDLVKK